VSDFNELNDFQLLGGPVTGLYLTPVSRDEKFLTRLRSPEWSEWMPLLLPSPQSIPNFPLQKWVGFANNECLLFSDRERWRQAQ
jgi:hypothetical protein